MITIDYFSDVLCVWAYGGQVRLDELQREFGDDIQVRHRFMTLFADTRKRIGEGWKDEGGFAGFGTHLHAVCEQWPHTSPHRDVWARCRPCSSTTAHVFLTAAGLCLNIDEEKSGASDERRRRFDSLVNRTRLLFFEHAQDISCLQTLLPLLGDAGLGEAAVRERIDNGEAYAMLHRDAELMKAYGVQGSPTYVFNEGRQLLYGNVGYRIIESNVRELMLPNAGTGVPSWC